MVCGHRKKTAFLWICCFREKLSTFYFWANTRGKISLQRDKIPSFLKLVLNYKYEASFPYYFNGTIFLIFRRFKWNARPLNETDSLVTSTRKNTSILFIQLCLLNYYLTPGIIFSIIKFTSIYNSAKTSIFVGKISFKHQLLVITH